MFSNHFSSSSPFILKFLYVGKIKLRQREFYSKDKRSNQVSIFKQPLDFLDGRVFTEMPKISLTQPQEGVWNLLLLPILPSKLFSTRAHRELQKDCAALNWAEPFESRASLTARCFGERLSPQKYAAVLLPCKSAAPEKHSPTLLRFEITLRFYSSHP